MTAATILVATAVHTDPSAAQVFTSGVRLDLTTASGPRWVQMADLNGDGRPDLVTANYTSASVSVLLATGGGAFLPRTDYTVGSSPNAVAIDDVNGDGRPDLVVANYSSSSVSVLIGNGAGGFGARTDYPTGSQPQSVAIADLNNDGRPDIVTADGNSNAVSVLLANGSGGFAPRAAYVTGSNPFVVQVADLNNDGNLDLAVANYYGNTISVLLGNGTGVFAPKTDYATGTTTSAVVVADVNNDGKPDLVASNLSSKSVSVLIGNGSGGFAPKTDFAVNGEPSDVVVADFNNDGRLDFATANYDSFSVSVLAGDGAGGFGGRVDVPVAPGTYLWGLTAGDVNGDGRTDIVAANIFGTAVSVLLQPPAFAAKVDSPSGGNPRWIGIADLNGDGRGEVATANVAGSVSMYLGSGTGLGPRNDVVTGGDLLTVAFGDVNNDGVPDLVVSNYGTNSVQVMTSNGAGGISGSSSFGTGLAPQSAAIGDVTGDGRPDLVVTNGNSNTISVLQGLGGGSFAAKVDYATGSNPMCVALADLNDDGKLDAVVTDFYGGTVSILLNNGSGAFPTRTDLATGTFPSGVAFGDFNGDSRPDIAVANNGSNSVSVFLATGPGTFGGRTDWPCGASPFAVIATDVNGDGRIDIATANSGSNTVGVLFGTGTGSFGSKVEYPCGGGVIGVAAGDINGDGRPDFATANYSVNTVSALMALQVTRTSLSASPAPCVLGAPLVLQATVAPVATASLSPADSVRFYDGTTLIGTAAVIGGQAGLTVFAARLGQRAFTAVYKGDGRFAGSTSSPARVRVVATLNPSIASIVDVGADQGHQVRLRFRASGADYRGAGSSVTRYDVYRRDVAGLAPARLRRAPAGRTSTQVDGWDFVTSVTSRADSAYVVVVPTLADSNGSGFHRATLFVSAVTASPATYYDSAPDSGYSVDNLPPAPPAPFLAAYVSSATHLHWGANTESDLWYYALYRGSSSGFTPGAGNLVATRSDTGYVDAGPAGSWYKLAAVDVNGNVSAYATLGPANTTAVGDGEPLTFTLDAVRPNPVTSSRLEVQFVLPDAAPATLELMDVAGRRVATENVGLLGPGRHALTLALGRGRPPGVYLLRLSHGSTQFVRRVSVME